MPLHHSNFPSFEKAASDFLLVLKENKLLNMGTIDFMTQNIYHELV